MSRESSGYTEVLYVRVAPDLIELLDRAVDEKREKEPHRPISRSDLVREILYRELSDA